MMAKRKAITAQMKLDALLFRLAVFEGFHIQGTLSPLIFKDKAQCVVRGIYLKCGICGEPIAFGAPIQWDHIHAISMGGPHDFRNLRPTHAECNHAKGIREHRAAAKVARLRGETKTGPKAKIAKRGFPKGQRKMQSRPFQRAVT